MMLSKCWSENNADSKIVVLSSQNQFRSFRSGGRWEAFLFRIKRRRPVKRRKGSFASQPHEFVFQTSFPNTDHPFEMKLIPTTYILQALDYKRLFLTLN